MRTQTAVSTEPTPKTTGQSLRPFPAVSVVIPLFNEEDVVETTVRTVFGVLSGLSIPDQHEVLCVNDGSRDSTLPKLLTLRHEFPRLVVIGLSRNFGHQAAVTAGMDHARGDAVFVIDGDLQDDPTVLGKFIEEYRDGADVVYAQRTGRKESLPMRAAYALHYRLLSTMSSVDIPIDAGDFALVSRDVADVMSSLPERQRYLRGLRAWVGFKQVGVAVERGDRAGGASKYSLADLVGLALDGILAFSVVPLRIATALGLFGLLGGLVFGVYALVARIATGAAPQGFTALALLQIGFGGTVLLMLGVLGEYVGRIYEEVKARPIYVIERTFGVNDG
jgi:polyisoprenyl-phosphate glycosyltransferase